MAQSYKYQQNVWEGSSIGYVKYNITPDFGNYISPGTKITYELQVFHKNIDIKSIMFGFTNVSGDVQEVFPMNISISKNTVAKLKASFTMWQLTSSWGSNRVFNMIPFFMLMDGENGIGSGDTLYWQDHIQDQVATYLAYRIDPVISNFYFERYEEEESEYVKNDEGTYVFGSIKMSLAEGRSLSDITIANLVVKNEDDNDTVVYQKTIEDQVVVNALTNALTSNGYIETSPILFANFSFDSAYDYRIELTIGDNYTQATASASISRAFANMHMSGYRTGGIAFGRFSSSKENEPKFECDYPSYLYGGINEVGNVLGSLTALGIQSGAIAATSISDDGSPGVDVVFKRKYASVPTVVCGISSPPSSNRHYLGGCSVSADAITENGFTLYRSNRSGHSVSFGATWIAIGQPNTDPNSWGVITVVKPASAMTSNSSQNCVATASSEYSSKYKAYQAFSSSREKGWASLSSDSSPWIQLQMDVALKNIVVSVYSRDNSNIFNPTAGKILGSNDGNTYDEIGSFSGWSSSAKNALLGTIECENSVAYQYVRILITGRTDTSHYVAIGHITIEGDYEDTQNT